MMHSGFEDRLAVQGDPESNSSGPVKVWQRAVREILGGLFGSEVEVAVMESDASGGRIRLSKKAVAQQREQAELREYAARQDATPSTSLGSLAGALRDALKGRQ